MLVAYWLFRVLASLCASGAILAAVMCWIGRPAAEAVSATSSAIMATGITVALWCVSPKTFCGG